MVGRSADPTLPPGGSRGPLLVSILARSEKEGFSGTRGAPRAAPWAAPWCIITDSRLWPAARYRIQLARRGILQLGAEASSAHANAVPDGAANSDPDTNADPHPAANTATHTASAASDDAPTDTESHAGASAPHSAHEFLYRRDPSARAVHGGCGRPSASNRPCDRYDAGAPARRGQRFPNQSTAGGCVSSAGSRRGYLRWARQYFGPDRGRGSSDSAAAGDGRGRDGADPPLAPSVSP